jgi:hypothetical protein
MRQWLNQIFKFAIAKGLTDRNPADEVDLETETWPIEKRRELMKRGYAHLTPLQTQAVELLRALHRRTGTFEYAFVGRNDPEKNLQVCN